MNKSRINIAGIIKSNVAVCSGTKQQKFTYCQQEKAGTWVAGYIVKKVISIANILLPHNQAVSKCQNTIRAL